VTDVIAGVTLASLLFGGHAWNLIIGALLWCRCRVLLAFGDVKAAHPSQRVGIVLLVYRWDCLDHVAACAVSTTCRVQFALHPFCWPSRVFHVLVRHGVPVPLSALLWQHSTRRVCCCRRHLVLVPHSKGACIARWGLLSQVVWCRQLQGAQGYHAVSGHAAKMAA
jgi:hypothetical protein